MKQEEAKKLPKAGKVHPMLASLPTYLKDPKNYEKVQRALLDAGATKHSHGEIVEWAACVYCQQRQHDRKEMMYRLGFRSGAQYMAWKQVHEEIKKRNPLVNWKLESRK